MTHQPRDINHETYPEMELSLKLSQIESAFKFLEYMNNEKTITGEELPRNTTERCSVKRNHERVQECRQLLKQIINEYRYVRKQPAIKVANVTAC